jgi:hypothetical protein
MPEETQDLEQKTEEQAEEQTEEQELEQEQAEEPEEEKEEEEEEPEIPKYQRPLFKDIKTKYPDFFKDFPDMREVYFREGKYSSIFPTVEDAEEAFNKSSLFDTLAQDLSQGSVNALLDTLEQGGKNLLYQVAENFLPSLYSKDQNAYYNVVGPIIGEFIKSIFVEGEKTGDENLKAVALHAAKFGFGTTNLNEIGLKRKQIDPQIQAEKERLEKERQTLEIQRYNEVYSQVAERSQKILLTEIARNIKIEDSYKRSAAIRDVFEKINEVLSQDPRHIKLMNTLWLKSKNSGYSIESRNKIVSTLIGRAKQIMPAVVKEILGEVEPEKPTGGKVGPLGSKEVPSARTGKVDWSKYKDEKDFINAFVENKGKVARV